MKHKACTAVFSDHHFVGLFYRPVAYHLWHHLDTLLFNCGAQCGISHDLKARVWAHVPRKGSTNQIFSEKVYNDNINKLMIVDLISFH